MKIDFNTISLGVVRICGGYQQNICNKFTGSLVLPGTCTDASNSKNSTTTSTGSTVVLALVLLPVLVVQVLVLSPLS
jgi:hypothetical protein